MKLRKQVGRSLRAGMILVAALLLGCAKSAKPNGAKAYAARKRGVIEAVRRVLEQSRRKQKPAKSPSPGQKPGPPLPGDSLEKALAALGNESDATTVLRGLEIARRLQSKDTIPFIAALIPTQEQVNPNLIVACRAIKELCAPQEAVNILTGALRKLEPARLKAAADPRTRNMAGFFIAQRMQTMAREMQGVGAEAVPSFKEHFERSQGYMRTLLATCLAVWIDDVDIMSAIADHIRAHPEDDGCLNDHFVHSLSVQPSGREALIELLNAADQCRAHLIAHTLGAARERRAVPALRKRLLRGDVDTAAPALGEIGGRETEDALMTGLKSDKEYIVAQCASELCRLGCERALPRIRPLLFHRHVKVRRAAAGALLSLGDSTSAETGALLLERCPRILAKLEKLPAGAKVPDAYYDRRVSTFYCSSLRDEFGPYPGPTTPTPEEVVFKYKSLAHGTYIYMTPETERALDLCDGSRSVRGLADALAPVAELRRDLLETLLTIQAFTDLKWEIPAKAAKGRLKLDVDAGVPLITRAYTLVRYE